MNQKFTQFFLSQGMSVTGNGAYGIVRGYETSATVAMLDTVAPLRLHIAFYATDEQKRNIETAFRNAAIKWLRFTFTPYGGMVGLNDITVKRLITKMPDLIEKIYGILENGGALGKDYCPVCGDELLAAATAAPEETAEEKSAEGTESNAEASQPTESDKGEEPTDESNPVEESKPVEESAPAAESKPAAENKPIDGFRKCNVDGYTITMHNRCANNINAVINAENADFNNAPNNYLKGFLGALIGGVVGIIVQIIIYSLGFISSISAFVSILLGAFLYRKFGGKQNAMMIVIVAVTTVVCMLGGVLVIYIVAASNEGVAMSGIEAFTYLMQSSSEFSLSFYLDLSMTFVFTIIGIIFQIIDMSRRIKRTKSIG